MKMIDIETILGKLETRMKSDLNTFITDMNTEKADSITLKLIADAGYFFQTLNDSLANFNPFVFYGVASVESVGIGPGTGKVYTIEVAIILEDRGEDLLIGKRMLRYGRVLEDFVNSKWEKILPGATFKTQSLVPVAFTLQNTNQPYRAVGIDIVTAIG